MTITMYDDTNVSLIPSDAQAVACYADGHFANCTAMRAHCPHARILEIAVSASTDAECLDIETGDASAAQAPAWVKRQHARGVERPVVYANTSTMPSVLSALKSAGIPRSSYRVWTAHYTGIPHIELGSDATQYTDRALGRSLDASLCADDFFDPPPAPKPVPEPTLTDTQRRPFAAIWNAAIASGKKMPVDGSQFLTSSQRAQWDAIFNFGFDAGWQAAKR